MNDPMKNKIFSLRELLREMGSVLVCFSGGVDSSFLLKAAVDELGKKNAVGLHIKSALHPSWTHAEARCIAEDIGAKVIELDVDVMLIPGVIENPPDRCYHCKRQILETATHHARSLKLKYVVDGTNADDVGDYRPGMQAVRETGVRSPLLEVGMTKREIRQAAKQLKLPNWDKPSYTCLATRFPTGTTIDEEKLRRVAACEDALREEGFGIYRVRYHGDLVRIEIDQGEFPRMFRDGRNEIITDACRKAGFRYVALDMEGYRTGSMNSAPSNEKDDKRK